MSFLHAKTALIRTAMATKQTTGEAARVILSVPDGRSAKFQINLPTALYAKAVVQ